MKKSPGEKFKQKGFAPNLPVLILPGLCSSCLKVVESPYKEWNDRRIWLDITTIGFGKVWDQIGFKKRKKTVIQTTGKKMTISSPTAFTSTRAITDMYSQDLITLEEDGVDNDDIKVDLDIDQDKKRRWIGHMVLQADGITDPPGIKLRPLEGIRGVMYLDPGAITNSLSYVFGPLVETYWDIGYTDANIRAAPYDWRVPPFRLEERDQYFTKLKEMIEDMVVVNKKKIVILAHSLGTRLAHYFLRRANALYGRQWISDHIHTWVAIGPLFLGAPKSVRAITSGERMGLDAFLFEEEGLDLSRLCGSSSWMFPYICPDYDFDGYVHKNVNGQWISQSIKDTLIESGVPHLWDNYVKYYHQDPYFGVQEDQLKAPPVDRLFAIYGINLRTEAFYFYKKSSSGISALELDSKGQLSNYECQGGIAFETKDTRQNKLKGRKRGGDGTVTYPSLSYCTYWKDEINVIIEELEGAEHREILKDKSFTKTVVEYVCTAPPPPSLPETFRELRYEVQEIRDNKKAPRTVVFTRKNVEVYRPNGQVILKKKYPQILSVQIISTVDQIFAIEIQGVSRLLFNTDRYYEITQELMVRLKFIEYSRSPTEEQRDELGQTELHRAVLDNDISLVRELLSDDRDINAQDKNDWTPLHCATYKRHIDIAILLLKSPKIDPSLLTKDATSSFHYLVRPGPDKEPLEEVLEHFLESGINVNLRSKGGATPLHHAAMYGSVRSARWLISKFANINAVNENGETALHIAIYQNNRDMIELLLTNGADKHVLSSKGKSPLACAQSISQDLSTFVRDFKVAGFRARALFEYQGFGIKELSFKEGDRIGHIRIDDSYGNGWWYGECNGNSGYFPSNYVKISEVIQDANRPPLGSREPEDSAVDVRDEYGQTPLHKAAYEDRCDAVFELLIGHANVNAVDRNGWTPFHCAASKGNVEVMLLLQQQPGVKLSIRSTDGTTALHYLVRNKYELKEHPKVIKILERFLSLQVDVDILGKNDETPLHQAVMRDNEFTVKFLLENGANVNAVNDSNTSPLFYAVGTRSIKLIELLLRYGADPTIKGKRGSSLDAARSQDEIYELLSRNVTIDHSHTSDKIEPPPVPQRKNGMSEDFIQRRPAPNPRKRNTISNQFALQNNYRDKNRGETLVAVRSQEVEEDFVEYTPLSTSVVIHEADPFEGLLNEKFEGNWKEFEEACIKFIVANKYKNDRAEFMKSFDGMYPPPKPSPVVIRSASQEEKEEKEKDKKSSFFKRKDKKKDK